MPHYLTFVSFAWRHRSIMVTMLSQKRPTKRRWRKQRSTIVFSGIVCSRHKIVCKNQTSTFVTVNNVLGSLVMRCANDFHSWLRLSRIRLANSPTRGPKIVIHGKSCIIIYICSWLGFACFIIHSIIQSNMLDNSVIICRIGSYIRCHAGVWNICLYPTFCCLTTQNWTLETGNEDTYRCSP